ncbi:hypothetical protein ACP70R_018901 [Stipagrostis hirtigluma subsp. patula]
MTRAASTTGDASTTGAPPLHARPRKVDATSWTSVESSLCRAARDVYLENSGESWRTLAPGTHTHKPNDILGLLCREHFPGKVRIGERLVPASTFEHYAAVPDHPDREGRYFPNKAERVIVELWDFFRCEPGKEAEVHMLARAVCKKKVTDLMYEAPVQAVVDFSASMGVRVTKEDARTMYLTAEQDMK